jgi:hypothetical protein
MNSNLNRAAGDDRRNNTDSESFSMRTWNTTLALMLVTVLSALSAFATSSVQVGNQGMNQPRGMIRSTVPNPVAGRPPLQDYWVADTVAGFCRLDSGVLNASTCYAPGVFEPVDYQVETNGLNGSNGYVFVAGTGGIHRLSFIADPNPANAGKTIIDTANIAVFLGPGSLFTNNVPVVISNRGGGLPSSIKLGPDRKLYATFIGNTDIWRVLNPLSPTFTPQGNKVERVGVTEGTGGRGVSLAWIGHDLWLNDYGFINRIQNADQCFYTFPKCSALLQFNNLFAEVGMTSDQFISSIPNGRYLYFANGSRIIRYDTTTPGFMQVWNQNGVVPPGTTPQGYSLILGLNFLQTATPTALPDGSFVEDLAIVNDPTVNDILPPAALTPPSLNTGVTWLLAASPALSAEAVCDGRSTTATIQNPPPCAISPIGSPGQAPSPNPVAAKRAILLASGVTHPRGVLWLNSHWWVSDEALGFCRIDVNVSTGAGSLTNCFRPAGDATFFPGQTAASAPDASGAQVVYVPDASGLTQNIYRFQFTPSASGGTLTANGILNGLGARKGTTIETVALPTGPFNDGSLYLGYSDSGFIEKITHPATAPAASVDIGKTFNGIGVISMAFNGNDLYLSELGPPPIAGQFIKKGVVTMLTKASPSLSQGKATPVKRALARLQAPQIIVENPGGFAVGPTGGRPFCLPPPGVKLSSSVPDDPATTPAFYIGTLGLTADGVVPDGGVTGGLGELPELDQYDFVCNTQQVWVTDGAVDPLLSTNVPLGAVTAVGFSGNDGTAVLALGDDPSVIVPTQTRQRGVVRKDGPPGTGSTGAGHVYIVP